MDGLTTSLMQYDWGGDRGALMAIDNAIREAGKDAGKLASIEQALLQVAQSDANVPAREYACRNLAIIGTAHCVPALATLLSSPELADLALIALQEIPGEEAGEALRTALGDLSGKPRIGVVNALGERRDRKAVPLLTPLSEGTDALLAGAARSALRKIGPAA